MHTHTQTQTHSLNCLNTYLVTLSYIQQTWFILLIFNFYLLQTPTMNLKLALLSSGLFALQVLGNEHPWYVVTLYANGERKGSVECYPGWMCKLDTEKKPNPTGSYKFIWMDAKEKAHIFEPKKSDFDRLNLQLTLKTEVLGRHLDVPDANGARIMETPDGSTLFYAPKRWSYNHLEQYSMYRPWSRMINSLWIKSCFPA